MFLKIVYWSIPAEKILKVGIFLKPEFNNEYILKTFFVKYKAFSDVAFFQLLDIFIQFILFLDHYLFYLC